MPILLSVNANSHTCGFDAITFVGFLDSSEVTINECSSLVFLGFPFLKLGVVQIFGPNL